MGLKLYNTLRKKKEPFISLEEGKVKLYLCGPTVYDYLHIGNFRGPVFFNLMRNWLEHLGYEVHFVYNYTDVDDKIIQRAQKEGVSAREISEKYIQAFQEDFARLKLRPHSENPRVTDFMPQIIEFIEGLVKKGVAYVVEGEVFYSIESFKNYGQLSGKNLEDLNAGERVEVDVRKKSPFDFVLWKPSKEGEPSWSSPWGPGRPGWHIECSAMIRSLLGESIDIHGGGIDLIFPHHENEIAQGEGLSGECYCRYWVHNNFINLDNDKMSKSLGNIIKCRDFLDKYNGEIFKYLMLSTHYRSLFNVTDEKIHDSIAALERVYFSLLEAQAVEKENSSQALAPFQKELAEADKKIEDFLNDDFNTAGAFGVLFEVVRKFNGLKVMNKKQKEDIQTTAQEFRAKIHQWGTWFSLFKEEPQAFLEELREIKLKMKGLDKNLIESKVKLRDEARKAKDFKQSDLLRDELTQMGVELVDGNPFFSWRVS